jgi:hypothetical protein
MEQANPVTVTPIETNPPISPPQIIGNKRLTLRSGRKASLKYMRWLKEYINSGNATQSALKAYHCSPLSARQIGYENIAKLDYTVFMEQFGITDALLMSKLNEGLSSDKVHTSHTEADTLVPDMPTRHKYLETALKLKKRLTNSDITIVSDKTLILDATT